MLFSTTSCGRGRWRERSQSELFCLSSCSGSSGDAERSVSSKSLDDAVARAFYVERFEDYLALEQGASFQTSKAYKLDIARFVTYASIKGAASAAEVGARTL